jgi:hypothetical protein
MRPFTPITNCERGCTRIKLRTMHVLLDSCLNLKEYRGADDFFRGRPRLVSG